MDLCGSWRGHPEGPGGGGRGRRSHRGHRQLFSWKQGPRDRIDEEPLCRSPPCESMGRHGGRIDDVNRTRDNYIRKVLSACASLARARWLNAKQFRSDLTLGGLLNQMRSFSRGREGSLSLSLSRREISGGESIYLPAASGSFAPCASVIS